MYMDHYGLTKKPFSIVPDPNILFLSDNHANALAYLDYGLSEKAGFILLTGEIGIGKTTLIRHLLNKATSQMDVAVIFSTNFSSNQLLSRILSEFEIPCDTAEKQGRLEMLYRYLIERYAQGRRVLLIIDEAQHLPDDALEEIRMLSNLQTDDQILLQIMLVGQTELKTRLCLPSLHQLAQRIAVNYHLSALNEEQTQQYIAYRLQMAGGSPDLISPGAMRWIYRHSGGIPRTINLLCDAGLVYGYAENKKRIDRTMIEKVLQDGICLSAASHEQNASPPAEDPTADWANSLLKRVVSVEASLADLQTRLDSISRMVRSELNGTIQEARVDEQAAYHTVNQQEITDSPGNYTFKDSAAGQAIDIEGEHHSLNGDAPAIEFRQRRVFVQQTLACWERMRATLTRLLRAQSNEKPQRPIALRYLPWIIIILVPTALLSLLFSVKQPTSGRNADQAVEKSSDATPFAIAYQVPPSSPSTNAADTDHTNPPALAPVLKKPQRIHIVKAGETLSAIAKRYDITVDAIIAANNLRHAHLINIGQKLKIPLSKSSGEASNRIGSN